MITNTYKDNDIFVSTLLNPSATVFDFASNEINAGNSQFLTKEEYKQSDFVKKQFTDVNGKFNDDLFNKAYIIAAQTYLNLSDDNLLQNLDLFLTYNSDSLYAPINAKTRDNKMSITRIRNPFESVSGVRTLHGTETGDKSVRELAQKSKIYDSETGQYLNKSAEDLGFFGGLFSKPLVYAKWDQDGTHFDPVLGREVTHKKGEYRLNEDGKFFTETIGKKQGYDQEFVALSDILTKEDSWLNKIDFFDSDDKDKSVAGIMFKTAAKIIPFVLPWTQGIWGGITAAFSLAEVLPTFAKALEGLVTNNETTAFTDNMSLLENYFKRFDNSLSDSAQGRMFGLEQFGQTVSDIFGLLYQMRAMANLSNLTNLNWTKTLRLAKDNFIKNHKNELHALLGRGAFPKTEAGIQEFWTSIAASTPELNALIKQQSKLARNLSFGYMALITSEDVYKEALAGGFDRRTAGVAALAATLGQYGMMASLDPIISTYFLDSVVGYRGGENRYLINRALNPLISKIESTIDKIPGMSKEVKQKTLGGIVKEAGDSLKKAYYSILDGSSEFWTRSIGEAVEEVSEEFAMDVTKGMFDAMSYFGFTGNVTPDASFNTLQNTFSTEGALRYLQNALGGFLGGSLFHLQQNYVTPILLGKTIDHGTVKDLVKLVLDGRAEEAKQVMRDIGARDNNVAELPEHFNNIQLPTSANGTARTRGQLIADIGIQQIEFLEGIMGKYNANLSLEEIVSKVIRDKQILKLIEDSNIDDLILNDFDSAVATLAEKIANLKEGETESAEINALADDINKFLTGENLEFYLKAALAYLNSNIRDNLSSMDLYTFTKALTGKDLDALTKDEQTAVINKHKEYLDSIDKKEYMKVMVKAMDELESSFSPAFMEYANTYQDIRKLTIGNLLSAHNWYFGEELSNQDYYNLLLDISVATKNSSLKGATIEDIFEISPEAIKDTIGKSIYEENKELIDNLAISNNLTSEQIVEAITVELANRMSQFPIQQWNTDRILKVLDTVLNSILNNLENKIEDAHLTLHKQFYADVSKSIIKAYIANQDILDGELVRKLKRGVRNSLTDINLYSRFNQALYNIVYEDEFGDTTPVLSLSESLRSYIKDILVQSLDQNVSLDEIAHAITDYLVNSYKSDSDQEISDIFVKYPQVERDIFESVKDFLNSDELLLDFIFVKENSTKQIIQNPLYELLRKISFKLSPEVNTTIFNLLEELNTSLSATSDITEFVKMLDLQEQLQNAKSILGIAKAILAGMESGELTAEHLFTYNDQVNKFLKSFKNGELEKYATLKTLNIYTIGADLDLIEAKLDFILELSKLNTASKKEEDIKTRVAFYHHLTDRLIQDQSKFTIAGVSILTPDDLEKLDSYEENKKYIAISKLEHKIYDRFQEILKTTTVEKAITELLDNIGLDFKNMALSSLESYGLSKNIKLISDYDYLAWITTILSVDLNLYQSAYRQYLKQPEVEKVPLFILEYNTKLGYSFLKDESGIHTAVVKYVESKSPEYPVSTTRFAYIDGISGSGKTTAIAKTILDLAKQSDIIVAAPNNDQKIKLLQALNITLPAERILSVTQLLEKFIDKNIVHTVSQESMIIDKTQWTVLQHNDIGYDSLKSTINSSVVKEGVTDIPRVVIIDEATHVNTAQLLLLELAANKYNFKLLILGDMYQESATIGNSEAHVDQIFTWKGPRLNISIRPANVNKKDNIDAFTAALNAYYGTLRETHKADLALAKLQEYLETGITLKYYEDATSLDGDKIVSDISVEDLNKLKRIANGNKIGIITKLDDSGLIMDSEFKAILDSSDLTPNDYILKSPDKIHPNAVQGSEFDYIVINDSAITTSQLLQDQIKKLYTLVTRSQIGGIIKINSQDIINSTHILPRITSKPSLFRLPGLNLLQDIKQQRVADINEIIGEQTIEEAPVQSSSVIPQNPLELQGLTPEVSTGTFEIPIEGRINLINSQQLFCYGFYSHTGLRLDAGRYVDGNRILDLDLSGLKKEGFSKEAVSGFIKLKNLITLYALDESGIKRGLGILNNFTKDIATFIKEVNINLQNVDDISALKWLQKSIHVESTPYVIGVKMDLMFDSPLPGFGLYDYNLVENGAPLLLMGRKINISDGIFSLERFISTGVLAKNKTVLTSKKAPLAVKQTIFELECKAASDLSSKNMVVYTSPEEFSRFGNSDGRLFRGMNEQETFDSIAALISGGVNVKEVGMITSAQNPNGTYKFNEWARQFCPDIDKLTIKNGQFTHSGRYFARVSYTAVSDDKSSPSITDHVLLLDLAQIKTLQALVLLKTARSLLEKKLILHAAGYAKVATEIVKKLGAFQANTSNSIQIIFKDLLNILYKNKEKYETIILKIESLLSQPGITLDTFLNAMLSNSTLSLLMTDFLVTSVSPAEKDVIIQCRNYGTVTISNDLKLYTNVSISETNGLPDQRGICQLSDYETWKLGLRNNHYEPAMFGLSVTAIQNLKEGSIENNIGILSKPAETPKPALSVQSNSRDKLIQDVFFGEEPTSLREIETINLLSSIPDLDTSYISLSDNGHVIIDDAYIELLNIKQKLNEIENKYPHCD